MVDSILVVGAAGFVGKLALEYLANHPSRNDYELQAGARSQAKIDGALEELKIPKSSVKSVIVDITDIPSIEKVVRGADVILNCAGPYHRNGTNVVAACAKFGKHYTDVNAEAFWMVKIARLYHEQAKKTGAIIVPACGATSVPLDLLAWLSVRHLKTIAPGESAGESVSAANAAGGVSGGSWDTLVSVFSEVPKGDLVAARGQYSFSPVEGPKAPDAKWIYSLPHVSGVKGTFFLVSVADEAVVRRSWGLLKQEAENGTSSQTGNPREPEAYGDNFTYSEFMQTPNAFAATILSTVIYTSGFLMAYFPPFRWWFKRMTNKPGEGPDAESRAKGFMKIQNVTTSSSTPTRVVTTKMDAKGDPGYHLTSLFVAEAAITLLPARRQLLPNLARNGGGILTPVTALGDTYVEQLKGTGDITFESSEITKASTKKID